MTIQSPPSLLWFSRSAFLIKGTSSEHFGENFSREWPKLETERKGFVGSKREKKNGAVFCHQKLSSFFISLKHNYKVI